MEFSIEGTEECPHCLISLSESTGAGQVGLGLMIAWVGVWHRLGAMLPIQILKAGFLTCLSIFTKFALRPLLNHSCMRKLPLAAGYVSIAVLKLWTL